MVRMAVRSLLEYHDFEICGEAASGAEALRLAEQKDPEIIVLDLEMPGMNGIEAAHELRRISPSAKIIVLTMHTADSAGSHVLEFAHGFVTKVEAGRQLIATVGRLLHGELVPLAVTVSKNSTVKYTWQRAVADALDASPEILPAKINLAERAIAARLAGGDDLVSEERIAIKEALKALRQLLDETAPGPDAAEIEEQGIA